MQKHSRETSVSFSTTRKNNSVTEQVNTIEISKILYPENKNAHHFSRVIRLFTKIKYILGHKISIP